MAITDVDRDEIFLLFALTESARAIAQFDQVHRLGQVREQVAPGVERREMMSIFDSLRLALHFAGSVSRIFWPPAGNDLALARGKRLRDAVGLPERHRLKDRALRNHVEHIDERLDQWTACSPRPFTTVEMILYDDTHLQTRRQALASTAVIYDITQDAIIHFGDTFVLSDLRLALEDVQKHIGENLSSAHRAMSWVL